MNDTASREPDQITFAPMSTGFLRVPVANAATYVRRAFPSLPAMSAITQLSAALASRYEIEREIGAGGMATVYLARDVRHQRHVALKVLNPELGAVLGAERFLSEIRVTANLQHPNLLPLFDSGEADGLLFYVMPFVDGETLRARLEREKQLPVDDAVRIAVAVSSALAYAHEHGVIHRDLKPENILIQAGQPVIADFGIALAVSKAGGARVTQTGLSLGTPQYMSPEQAAGDRVIDGRSDIYSLGAVTYEMLGGEPPHSGTSAQAIIAKLMTSEPQPLRSLRKAVPLNVSDAVGKALEKSPADRFSSATAFAEALVNPAFSTRPVESAPTARVAVRGTGAIATAAAVAGVLAGMALWALANRPTTVARPLARVQIALRAGEEIIPPAQGPSFTMSHDGSTLVYTGPAPVRNWQLWRRRLNELGAVPIKGTEAGVIPSLSPDDREIAFGSMQDRKLRTVSIEGGTPLVIADSLRRGGLHWASDGFVYFRDMRNGISRVSPRGGKVEQVTTVAVRGAGSGHFWPQLLPGGALLHIDRPGLVLNDARVVVTHPGSGDRTVLTAGVYARYAPSGHLVWATADRTVLAARFDPKSFTLGAPVPVLDRIRVESFLGSADFAFSDDGRLFYQEGELSQDALVWISRNGAASDPIGITGFHVRTVLGGFSLSPDGKHLAITRTLEGGGDVWVKQLPDGPIERLTFEGTPNYWPSWTADGQFISFTSGRATETALFIRRADGTGRDSALLSVKGGVLYGRWAGPWLVASTKDAREIVAVRPGVDRAPRLITTSDRFNVGSGVVSPDEKWIAYVSNESGVNEVYVRPFPEAAGGKWLVSADGGSSPSWSRAGGELFYLRGQILMAATYTVTPTFTVQRRSVMIPDSVVSAHHLTGAYDVSPDGSRFLMSSAKDQGLTLILVENWFEELKRKVP